MKKSGGQRIQESGINDAGVYMILRASLCRWFYGVGLFYLYGIVYLHFSGGFEKNRAAVLLCLHRKDDLVLTRMAAYVKAQACAGKYCILPIKKNLLPKWKDVGGSC